MPTDIVIVNFSHPLTDEQLLQLQSITGCPADPVLNVKTQFNLHAPLAEQAVALVDGVGLSSEEWQTRHLLVIPPDMSSIACTVLAELHGRMGYFPAIVQRRKVDEGLFEVAEVINLQATRDTARARR